MGVLTCPNCDTANNDLRERCRKCGGNLRSLFSVPKRRGRGRISFELDAQRDVSMPVLAATEATLIPVLFEGKEQGITVGVMLHVEHDKAPTPDDLNRFHDAKVILLAALQPRPRRV